MFVEMAEITRGVGLKGEMKILPSGDFLEDVLSSDFLCIREGMNIPQPVKMRGYRWKSQTVILSLEGISDRHGADEMVGKTLGFRVEDYDHPDFPRPGSPAPFLYHGMEVVTEEGRVLGTVREVLLLPANPVLRVEDEDRSCLIPVIPPVIRQMDRENGRLVIHLLAGLLDEGDAPI